MEVGDLYYGLNGECWRELTAILSNPSETFEPFIKENITGNGYDKDQLLAALNHMVYDSQVDYYFDADGSFEENYSEFLLTGLEDFNETYPTSGSCAWEGSILTMICSTCGVDGI